MDNAVGGSKMLTVIGLSSIWVAVIISALVTRKFH